MVRLKMKKLIIFAAFCGFAVGEAPLAGGFPGYPNRSPIPSSYGGVGGTYLPPAGVSPSGSYGAPARGGQGGYNGRGGPAGGGGLSGSYGALTGGRPSGGYPSGGGGQGSGGYPSGGGGQGSGGYPSGGGGQGSGGYPSGGGGQGSGGYPSGGGGQGSGGYPSGGGGQGSGGYPGNFRSPSGMSDPSQNYGVQNYGVPTPQGLQTVGENPYPSQQHSEVPPNSGYPQSQQYGIVSHDGNSMSSNSVNGGYPSDGGNRQSPSHYRPPVVSRRIPSNARPSVAQGSQGDGQSQGQSSQYGVPAQGGDFQSPLHSFNGGYPSQGSNYQSPSNGGGGNSQPNSFNGGYPTKDSRIPQYGVPNADTPSVPNTGLNNGSGSSGYQQNSKNYLPRTCL